jgi:hypothetical protein
MVTGGCPQHRSVSVDCGCGEIHKVWATFGRVTGAKEAEPNFRMTDNLGPWPTSGLHYGLREDLAR